MSFASISNKVKILLLRLLNHNNHHIINTNNHQHRACISCFSVAVIESTLTWPKGSLRRVYFGLQVQVGYSPLRQGRYGSKSKCQAGHREAVWLHFIHTQEVGKDQEEEPCYKTSKLVPLPRGHTSSSKAPLPDTSWGPSVQTQELMGGMSYSSHKSKVDSKPEIRTWCL